MFQNQYFNLKLTKNHVEKILTNYNIKYNTMKNEIDAKFNNLIKLFLNDIREFLENAEDIKNERKKIKEFENSQMEIALLKSKLEEKTLNEHKMQSDIDLLTKENSTLKLKVKLSGNYKSKNLYESNNNSILKSESRPTKKIGFTGAEIKNKEKNKNKNLFSKLRIKTEGNKVRKKFNGRNNNSLSSSMEKKFSNKNIQNLKSGSIQFKGNKSVEKRNTQNNKNKIKNKNKNNYIQRTPQNKSVILYSSENVSINNINNKKINNTVENQPKINSEIPPFEPNFEEDDSLLTVDDVIEEEIKELEMDEENIILLIEEINNFKKEKAEKPN